MSIKGSIKQSLVSSGTLKLVSRLRPLGAAVLMYHSVLDDPEEQWLALGGIGHSTRVFRQQMEALVHHYHPISAVPQRVPAPRKSMVEMLANGSPRVTRC